MTTNPWPKVSCFALITPLLILNPSDQSCLTSVLRLYVSNASVYANHSNA